MRRWRLWGALAMAMMFTALFWAFASFALGTGLPPWIRWVLVWAGFLGSAWGVLWSYWWYYKGEQAR